MAPVWNQWNFGHNNGMQRNMGSGRLGGSDSTDSSRQTMPSQNPWSPISQAPQQSSPWGQMPSIWIAATRYTDPWGGSLGYGSQAGMPDPIWVNGRTNLGLDLPSVPAMVNISRCSRHCSDCSAAWAAVEAICRNGIPCLSRHSAATPSVIRWRNMASRRPHHRVIILPPHLRTLNRICFPGC